MALWHVISKRVTGFVAAAVLLTAACSGEPETPPPAPAIQAEVADTASEVREPDANPFAPPEIEYPAADLLLGWIDARQMQSLNGTWRMIVDPMKVGDPGSIFGGFISDRQKQSPYDLIEYDFRTSPEVQVPGDFNTQDERLFFYQGSIWYYRTFDAEPEADTRKHLWFGGVNFSTAIFLNGEGIGEHEGGYVPFSFDITDKLQAGTNTLIIRVDNSLSADTVPTARTDWWPYGGLIRDVGLVTTPAGFIRNAKIELTNREDRLISVEAETHGMVDGTLVRVSLPELGVSAEASIDTNGIARVEFAAPVELWTPSTPTLYTVDVAAGGETLSDRIGFRTVETRGQEILLNGDPLKLKGISTHEEAIGRDGIAYSEQDMRALLTEAKALNANFVRAAHYPYSRHMARAADEMGLLVWEEVPVYWNINWSNPETLDIARNMMGRLVRRDWNRASVIIWSVANETPYSEPRMTFLSELIDQVRTLDDTRLVSAALLGNPAEELREVMTHIAARGIVSPEPSLKDKAVFGAILAQAGEHAPSAGADLDLVITDPLAELIDVVAYNEYFGWYYSSLFARNTGLSEDVLRPLMLDLMADITLSAEADKPIHISEFGAGAKAGLRGDGVWTEDYQAAVYAAQIEMLRNSPQVQGMTPWILKDFRAMLRPLPGIQDYRNRKGLIDENGARKLAFGVLQDFYAGGWTAETAPASE